MYSNIVWMLFAFEKQPGKIDSYLVINLNDNIIDYRIAISVTPAIRLHFDFCSWPSIALRKPPSPTSRLPSNRHEMYTSAKQIPDYRRSRITFTYSIHLPLHTGGYWILLVAGAGSNTSYRKTVEGKKNVQAEDKRGWRIRITRLPGRATDDGKNGGIFIATISADSCLLLCWCSVYVTVVYTFQLLPLGVHFLEISVNDKQPCD